MSIEQFFSGKKIDFERTARMIYEKYKNLLGSANVQQLINRKNEAWSSYIVLHNAVAPVKGE
ncbi:MAG: hypothetical protein ACP5LF_01540 [Nitrososphaeria archaeon]|nr:hypothetical protein [Conexivisphaerales archaeon]